MYGTIRPSSTTRSSHTGLASSRSTSTHDYSSSVLLGRHRLIGTHWSFGTSLEHPYSHAVMPPHPASFL